MYGINLILQNFRSTLALKKSEKTK